MFINIRNISVLGIVAGMLAILLSLGLGAEQQTEAAVTTFEVSLTGAAENPPVSSPGSAFARFTFDDVTRQLTYAVTVSGLSPNVVTAAHIHRGAVGVNGPIVHFLSATGFTQVSGSITLSEADVADLRAGLFYANVHSVDHPGGFARGQMYLTPLEAIRGSVEGAIRAFNSQNLPTFLSYFTDSGLLANFDATRAELLALGNAFFEEGPPSPISYSGLTVIQSTANTAVTEMNLAFIKVVDRQRDFWVLEGGIWKINNTEDLPEVIPAGVTAVDMRLQEFAFVYDKSQVSSGRFAFKVQNAGKQFHEIILAKVNRTEPLLQLLAESQDGPPEGVEDFGAAFYEPGASGTFVLSEPLAAGRYALVCFIPDEADDIPHALKGMFSEFTVGGATTGGGVVRPPSTGDGGLLPSESDSVLATIGLVVMIASLGLLMGQKLRSAA